ncbi:MAG: glutathione S-transferase family protein [Gammaproteobacteria bacterium]|jgi:glutathione S-transferase|nr:glutathione S-transferase family protein [Gammaproteobacteria bacterium]
MSKLHLYSARSCPFARRTRITLLEKALDFELTEIDLANRPDNWDEISPYGKVPVLLHGDDRLWESAIINQYLDERFPEPALMPADPLLRAQARIWMDYCDTRFSAASWQLMQAKDDPEKRAAAHAAMAEICHFIEHEALRKLGAGPFWMGAELTLVDIQFITFMQRYANEPDSVIPADCSRLREWLNLLIERPSVAATAA